MRKCGFMCSNPVYQYKGFTFEFGYFGPVRLRKSGDPSKQQGRIFYAAFDEWYKLPDEEKKKTRCGGGCEPLVCGKE